jgi:anaerobic magnesium-protoporphyrin IX monomethyl ester cyclase
MAKILFVQNVPFEFMGPMYLSALLKKHGHECRLIIVSEEADDLRRIAEIDPDLIAFSTMTGPHKWVLETAAKIKRARNRPVILGGPHPTFFPGIIHEPCVDMICVGEGEFALLELSERLDRGEDISAIQNLWVKRDGKVFKNGLRPLIEDLDILPFPDRSLYDGCRILRSVPAMKFLTGRGCPHRCAFCFNHSFNELYRGLGRVVRKRNIDHLISEIRETARTYHLDLVRFPDDSFTGNRAWLLEFLGRYKKEIGLPYTGLARANELDEDVVVALKASGCLNVFFGVETGSEDLRNRVLKKNLTNAQLVEAARLLRKYKVRFGTYNMFGLPGETLAQALETIRLNHRLRPDYTINNMFQPYPRTEIVDYAVEHGFLDARAEYLETMNEGSLMNLADIGRITNLCRFAQTAIRHPRWLPLIKMLITLPPNRLFKLIYDATSAPAMKSNLNLSWLNVVRWGLRLRKIT